MAANLEMIERSIDTAIVDGIDDAVESVDVSVFTKLDVPFIFQFPVVCVSGEGLKGRGVLFWR